MSAWQRWWGWLLRRQKASASAEAAAGAGQPGLPAAPRPREPERAWVLMVYMAGDNGKLFETKQGKIQLMAEMTTFGYRDLAEMASVGTTPDVGIVCLFDTADDSYLVRVRKGQGFANSEVERLAEVSTGEAATLTRFIVDTVHGHPAERYALVLWNHGTGWLDVDYYAPARALPGGREGFPPIFRSTARQGAGTGSTRPIAYDDTSKDFLDSRELRLALADAEVATGRRLTLIGMDACLMAMVEGARELAPHADFFVASQEVEPMAGWPYGTIVAAIDDRPAMEGGELAQTIVDAFAHSFGGATRSQTVTQSAIALASTARTEDLCKQLVDTLLSPGYASLRRLIRSAAEKTQAFQEPAFRDLGDFVAQVIEVTEWENYREVTAAARALRDHLATRSPENPVLRLGYVPQYERATGLSVYLPTTKATYAPDAYRHLAFPTATGWDRMLDWLLE